VRREQKTGLELFVNRRLEVRFLSPAPHRTSCDPPTFYRNIVFDVGG
jgi:hypothetical protein